LIASEQVKGQLPPLEIFPVNEKELQAVVLSWQIFPDGPVQYTQLEFEIQSLHLVAELHAVL